MNLLQLIVELRHAEPLKLFSPYEQLYRSITKKELKGKAVPLPGFQLDIAEEHIRIVVEPARTAIVMGRIENINICADKIRSVYRKILDITELPPLKRLGIRSYFSDAVNTSFDNLAAKFKDMLFSSTFMSNAGIASEVTDTGASFTLKDKDYRANIAFGPMELKQLETILVFKQPDLPKVSFFFDIDYYLHLDNTEMNETVLNDFLRRGIRYASEKSQQIASALGS